MAKIQIKPEKLTPFGGIFSIMDQFDSMLSSVIDSTSGKHCKLRGYQHSEIFLPNGIQQCSCFEMPTLMPITQVADAPPCNTDGAQPPFTLSCCSQSDESAFCRYFTHTTRLCSFLRQS